MERQFFRFFFSANQSLGEVELPISTKSSTKQKEFPNNPRWHRVFIILHQSMQIALKG